MPDTQSPWPEGVFTHNGCDRPHCRAHQPPLGTWRWQSWVEKAGGYFPPLFTFFEMLLLPLRKIRPLPSYRHCFILPALGGAEHSCVV